MWAYMPRALEDPGKSQGPIRVPSGDPDGRDRQTGRECPPDPCLGWATRYVTYVVHVHILCCIHILCHIRMSRHKSYVTMHSISYVSLSGRSRLRLRPPSWEGKRTHATQRYLSIQQCTSSNGEKGGEYWEGLSPAYVSTIGSRTDTENSTVPTVNLQDASLTTCNLDCWLISNYPQVNNNYINMTTS